MRHCKKIRDNARLHDIYPDSLFEYVCCRGIQNRQNILVAAIAEKNRTRTIRLRQVCARKPCIDILRARIKISIDFNRKVGYGIETNGVLDVYKVYYIQLDLLRIRLTGFIAGNDLIKT